MRRILALVFASLTITTIAKATSDGHDRVFVVVQDVNDPEEFFVERAPIIGCYGLLQGPRLVAFTAAYNVPSRIGCNMERGDENVNYLTCAKLVSSKESADFTAISELTLDISKCEAKNNPKFITMVRTAAKMNFPQADKKKEVRLNLIK